MDWISKIVTIIASLLTIIDLFLKNYSTMNYGSFFTKSLFLVNLLEITIFILILFLFYKIFPKKSLLLQIRSAKFLKNWYKFKKILEDYHSWSNLQEDKVNKLKFEYIDVREALERDFNLFVSRIKEIQSRTHRQYNDSSINNFETCFSVRRIEDWKGQVRRIIPSELDCFDYLLISLKEDYESN